VDISSADADVQARMGGFPSNDLTLPRERYHGNYLGFFGPKVSKYNKFKIAKLTKICYYNLLKLNNFQLKTYAP